MAKKILYFCIVNLRLGVQKVLWGTQASDMPLQACMLIAVQLQCIFVMTSISCVMYIRALYLGTFVVYHIMKKGAIYD